MLDLHISFINTIGRKKNKENVFHYQIYKNVDFINFLLNLNNYYVFYRKGNWCNPKTFYVIIF